MTMMTLYFNASLYMMTLSCTVTIYSLAQSAQNLMSVIANSLNCAFLDVNYAAGSTVLSKLNALMDGLDAIVSAARPGRRRNVVYTQ